MMSLSGCGRQVSGLNLPEGGNGIVPVGQTLIRFETAGPLDFQNLTYLIVFNTTGNEQQPYAQGYNTDFRNWSAFFIVGGGAGFANAPNLLQVYQDPSSGAARTFNVSIPQGTMTFQTTIPTANAQFGFQITFNRCLLDLAPPSATAQPPISANRICPPYQQIATRWRVSLFTLDRTQSPVDSLGTTGPSDTSYNFGFETAENVNTNYFKPASNTTTQNISAQIVGIEVFSTPPTGSVAAPSPVPSASPSSSPTASPTRQPASY
ncbi:MAG TPA: hypothetical protein VGC96_13315 [Candidatus Elarobacter sp.]